MLLRSLVENIPVKASGCPIDNLEEGDDAEPKAEAKEPSKGGNEVHRSHPDASLQFFGKCIHVKKSRDIFSPMTVSLPKKMLTTAISSSQAL